MAFFDDWFTEKVIESGYKQIYRDDLTTHIWMTFQNGYDELSKDLFHVVYLRHYITPEFIRQSFAAHHDEHVLFVVDERVIASIKTDMPIWIRALHAIYYGRIYVYRDLLENISALHYDWDKKWGTFSEPIDIDGILFTDTDCKLKDFPGIFHIARFYDKAFWTESNSNKQTPNNPRNRQHKPPPSAEDVFRDFREAFERNKRHYQTYHDYEPVQPRYAPKDDKWLDLFIASGSIEAARAKYRELAKQFHPDLNPGSSEALSTMQAINIAFDKAKEYWK